MSTKLRVLYMEGDADARKLITYLLEPSHIYTAIAETISEAESMAFLDDFDVFLLDGITPFDKSLAFCRKLRAYAPQTPILFYSCYAAADEIRQGLEAGANHYLIKPYPGDLSQILFQAAGLNLSTMWPITPLPQLNHDLTTQTSASA